VSGQVETSDEVGRIENIVAALQTPHLAEFARLRWHKYSVRWEALK